VDFVVDRTAFQRHLNRMLVLPTFTPVLQCPPWVKRHICHVSKGTLPLANTRLQRHGCACVLGAAVPSDHTGRRHEQVYRLRYAMQLGVRHDGDPAWSAPQSTFAAISLFPVPFPYEVQEVRSTRRA
jgi:hypothetical protein